MTQRDRIKKRDLIVGLIILLMISCILLNGAVAKKEESTSAENANSSALTFKGNITMPEIPNRMIFAGEEVPLDIYWVKEGLDREVINTYYQHSRTLQIILRAGRYFPDMETILEKENVPKDFLYICVAESSLENVISPAKATGFWQFMEATGKKYGLEIRDEVDERYHLEKSTYAACKYLKNNKERLGSWTLAAAAYNMGETGIKTALNNQNCNNYWDLYLNVETARYLYRILAYKLIMENMIQYDINVCATNIYRPFPCREEEITSSIDLYEYAANQGVSYRELKMLNPWLRSNKLTIVGKKYILKLPLIPKQKFNDLYKDVRKPNTPVNNIHDLS